MRLDDRTLRRCRKDFIRRGAFCVAVAILAGCGRGPDAADAPERVLPAVVKIEAIQRHPSEGRLVKQWAGGSGSIISADGLVLTNYHVAQDADYFRCYLTDGTKLEARRVGEDILSDLALLRIDLGSRPKDAPPLPVARFGDSSHLKAGDVVFALGSPGFLAQSITRGIVANPSAVLPQRTGGNFTLAGEDVGLVVHWIMHDAVIYHGNSGGPLVNEAGEIVGVNEIGVFNLGGAIPGNLAHSIADRLAASGHIQRSWSGVTVQPRLEAEGATGGVRVSDVVPGSPAAAAGLQAGDVITAVDHLPVGAGEEEAVGEFYRAEMAVAPGAALTLDITRGGTQRTLHVAYAPRERAEAEDAELKPWGAVARDITGQFARAENLPDTKGVWLTSIRPGGPAGQGEPRLLPRDIIVAVEKMPIANVAALKAETERILSKAPRGVRTVLATVRRDKDEIVSDVRIRREIEPPEVTPEVRKGWLGAESQPLTAKLSAHLHIHAQGGARLTRIYPGTAAAKAGLRVGDIILALDGTPVLARREDDLDLLNRQIREYRPGTAAAFSIWREGQSQSVAVTIDREPVPTAEMPQWDDDQLEFSVREPAFLDLARLGSGAMEPGVLVSSVMPSGWAALGGLRADDLILKADDQPVATVGALRASRDGALKRGDKWWVLMVRRRGETLFVELNLKLATAP